MSGRGTVIYGAVTPSRQWDQRGSVWLSVCVPGEPDVCAHADTPGIEKRAWWVSVTRRRRPEANCF